MSVVLRDVTLRDGLQDESPVVTEAKLGLFEALVSAGIRDLELTSFVRADRVPAMADAEAMCAITADRTDVKRWGLVLNERGATRALAAGLRHLQWVISVSEAHQQNNAGQSVDDGIEGLKRVLALAADDGATVELTLATSFGCPFDGPVAPATVMRVAEAAAAAGVHGLGLADTIGTAVPTEIKPLVAQVASLGLPVGVHFHDTRGLAIANALQAIDAGVTRIDGSVGGLGGCPFAPGASGNLALEDLAHALDAMGIETGVSVDGMLEASRLACAITGRTMQSHVGVAGPRFAGTPFSGDD